MKSVTNIVGVMASILVSGCGVSSPSTSLELERRDGLESIVEIKDCKIEEASWKCIMTTNAGTINRKFLIGRYYDKDGVKLGEYRFPDDDVVRGEKSKTSIAQDTNIENVTRVMIDMY